MPKISIYERDLTTVGTDNITNNTVYIPGYAITGPVNTPTLCNTLEEFQEIFGYMPYRFRENQKFPVGFDGLTDANLVVADSLEKSYIYAVELLRNGLPVIFERYMNTNSIKDWTAQIDPAYRVVNTTKGDDIETGEGTDEGVEVLSEVAADVKFTVTAKYPGKLGSSISITMDMKVDSSNDKNVNVYTLTATLPKDVSVGIYKDLSDKVSFSFDKTRDDYYENRIHDTKYIDITLSSGLDENMSFGRLPKDEMLALPDTLKNADEFKLSEFYAAMAKTLAEDDQSLFGKLTDRNEYSIKFITSGAYPTFNYSENKIVYNMMIAAATRGDAIALVDYDNTKSVSDVYDELNKTLLEKTITVNGDSGKEEDVRKYGAMFAPYATYKSKVLDTKAVLPASFAYLNSLAISTKTNANWYAVAGVTRGLVPSLLQLSETISGAVADKLQSDSGLPINPITNIKPYGYCIWGNRTLNENRGGLIASSFLNVRVLASDVKKVVYSTAKKMTFELNTDILWLNFKAAIEPMLDKMVSGNGLTGYKILRKTSTKRATIEAIIRLYVVEAVEDWDITVELSDTTVSVE